MTIDLWPTLKRSLVAYPPETFAGAESWSAEALGALRDRWVGERLLGRGELVRILERTNDRARVEALLDVSLRRLLLSTGTARLMALVDAAVAARADSAPSRDSSAGELVQVLGDLPQPQLHEGFLLSAAPLADESVAGAVDAVIAAAGGLPPAVVVRETLARAYGLPLGIPPLDVTLLAAAPEAGAAATIDKLGEPLTEALRDGDPLATRVTAAFVAELAVNPDHAAELKAAVRARLAEAPGAAGPAPSPVSAEVEVPARLAHDPQRGPRQGEIWTTAPALNGSTDGLRLLLIGDPRGPEGIITAVPLGDDLDTAGHRELLFGVDDTTLGVPQVVPVHQAVGVPAERLDRYVGGLTPAGRTLLAQTHAGEVPADAFGPYHRYSLIRTGSGDALPAALAALRSSEVDDDDEEGVIEVTGDLDTGWPRRVLVHAGVVAVVDLLGGDVAVPATLTTPVGPGATTVAAAVRENGVTQAAARRLVAAEARVAHRPFGLWALDAALAAAELRDALEPALDGDTTLDELIVARIGRALTTLPDGDLLKAVLAGARGEAEGEKLLFALAPLAQALDGTSEGTALGQWQSAVRRATVRTTDLVFDDEPLADELTDTGLAGVYGAIIERIPLDPAALLSEVWAEETIAVEDQGATLRLRLTVRQFVLDAARPDVDPRIAAALTPGLDIRAGLWVTLFDPDTGVALDQCQLVADGARLTGEVARPDGDFGYAVGIRPRRWIGSEPMCLAALCTAPLLDGAAAPSLRAVGEVFSAEDWRHEMLTGLAGALDGGLDEQLPSGVLDSPASVLLKLCWAERARLGDVLLSHTAVPALSEPELTRILGDLDRLDGLLS